MNDLLKESTQQILLYMPRVVGKNIATWTQTEHRVEWCVVGKAGKHGFEQAGSCAR